jgi:phenylacetate-CoA ligase
VFSTGPAALLDNRSTPQEQAEWLRREEPDYLLIYPSVLKELARYVLGQGLRLRRLKGITTMGEVLTPEVRAACREALGVSIADMYSASETGYLALQCPLNEYYHVQSETVLLEVLDETGQLCAPGQIGTVVATPLHNYAMPLLRYAPGDLAEVGSACSCGRGLPVLKQILGRTRDTVMLPSGARRYAWVGLRRLGELREIVQFQVVQRTLYDLEIKLVVREALGPEQEEKIRQTLRDSLGAHFSVLVTYHDVIPRAPSGKYFDFVSEVPG